jgi:hypothetical protein
MPIDRLNLQQMKQYVNGIIGNNLPAFSGGAIGGFSICFKHLFLNVTYSTGIELMTFIGIFILKAFATSVMTYASGLVVAYANATVKAYVRKFKGKKKVPGKKDSEKNKAA